MAGPFLLSSTLFCEALTAFRRFPFVSFLPFSWKESDFCTVLFSIFVYFLDIAKPPRVVLLSYTGRLFSIVYFLRTRSFFYCCLWHMIRTPVMPLCTDVHGEKAKFSHIWIYAGISVTTTEILFCGTLIAGIQKRLIAKRRSSLVSQSRFYRPGQSTDKICPLISL